AVQLSRAVVFAELLHHHAEVQRRHTGEIGHAGRAGERDRDGQRLPGIVVSAFQVRHDAEIGVAARLTAHVADELEELERAFVVLARAPRILLLDRDREAIQGTGEEEVVVDLLGHLHAFCREALRLFWLAEPAIRLREPGENLDALPDRSEGLRLFVQRAQGVEGGPRGLYAS